MILEMKRLLKQSSEAQAIQKYPNFKNAIAKELESVYGFDKELALKAAFSQDVNDELLDDINWAQHMGPRYWAEDINDNKEYFLNS